MKDILDNVMIFLIVLILYILGKDVKDSLWGDRDTDVDSFLKKTGKYLLACIICGILIWLRFQMEK